MLTETMLPIFLTWYLSRHPAWREKTIENYIASRWPCPVTCLIGCLCAVSGIFTCLWLPTVLRWFAQEISNDWLNLFTTTLCLTITCFTCCCDFVYPTRRKDSCLPLWSRPLLASSGVPPNCCCLLPPCCWAVDCFCRCQLMFSSSCYATAILHSCYWATGHKLDLVTILRILVEEAQFRSNLCSIRSMWAN